MEASEKHQLEIGDGGGADGTVRALDDRLVIERLTVADERAARVVRERAKAGRPPVETVAKAIEIGARVLDSEETAANVDYVRAEFERHAGALRERLMKQLESGDEAFADLIARNFDGERDGSVQKEIGALVDDALTDQRDAILKLFKVEDGSNPLFDYKETMVKVYRELRASHERQGEENRKVIADLQREIVELRERDQADERVAEAEEKGTRKGRNFEERVHGAIERIADGRGDAAQRVGDERNEAGGKKGDVVVELGAANGNVAGKVVFEVKDKKLSRNDAWAELNGALAQRGAAFAVLVVAGEERVPARTETLHEYEGNKLIVAVDRDEPDDIALEIAYRYARCRVLLAREGELEVDAAGVRAAAEEAQSALKKAHSIKLALTGATDSVARAREGLEEMLTEVRDPLVRIESLIDAADQSE
ncbi:MAG TPA: hypothetical protein VFY99_01420 [Solirubrobacterales bacterium]